MHRTKPYLGGATLALSLALVAGCASPPHQDYRELEDLLEAYRRQTERASARLALGQARGIRAIKAEQRDGSGAWLVSAQLENAPLGQVVRRLLEETGTTYLVRASGLSGEVTARFERLPLRTALALLLDGQGLAAWERDGVLIIGEASAAIADAQVGAEVTAPHALPPSAPLAPGSAAPEPAEPPSPGTGDGSSAPRAAAEVSRAMQLRYLEVETAGTMFESLFPADATTGVRAVRLAALPATSTVMLAGDPRAVARAARLLGELDRDPAHVLLEVLVVEFDSNELERLGTSVRNYQGGRFTALAADIGQAVSATGGALSFSYTAGGAAAPRMFEAMIDILSAQDKARVIARPYTAAMSGKKAVTRITRERKIQQQFAGAGSGYPPDAVDSETGVMLDVTPWVMADGNIRLEISIEESVFTDNTANNVLSETDKNTATTTMMVSSGQSIIIGGLTVRRKSSSNAGLPWLRHVPILNLFTARQESVEQKQDVIIYITPYLIGPGVQPPFPYPDAFKFRDAKDNMTEMERIGGSRESK